MKSFFRTLDECKRRIPLCIAALVLFVFIVGCQKVEDPTSPEETVTLDGTWQSYKSSENQIFKSFLVTMVASSNRIYGNGLYIDELPFEISTGVYKSSDISFSFYLDNTNLGKVYCQFMGNLDSADKITGRLILTSSYGTENYMLNLTKQSIKYVSSN